MKLKVYLAGGINGLTYEEAFEWRKHVTQKLSSFGIECLNPIAAKDFDKYHKDGKFTEGGKTCYWRDIFLVKQADVVLINFDTVKSFGTLVEKGWCDILGKLVLIASSKDIKHPFVTEQAILFNSISDAIDFIKEL